MEQQRIITDNCNEVNKILNLIEKDCIVEDDEDAKNEGFRDLNEYNDLCELKKIIDYFIEKIMAVEESYQKEYAIQKKMKRVIFEYDSKEDRIRDIKKLYVQRFIRNKNQKNI